MIFSIKLKQQWRGKDGERRREAEIQRWEKKRHKGESDERGKEIKGVSEERVEETQREE